MNKYGFPNLRDFQRLTVYAVETYEGQGTTESLGRIVTTYFAEDGRHLWTDDPAPEKKEEVA